MPKGHLQVQQAQIVLWDRAALQCARASMIAIFVYLLVQCSTCTVCTILGFFIIKRYDLCSACWRLLL